MGTYKRILLATDFSEPAGRAQVEAVRLAREQRAELHVLYVDVIAGPDLGGFADPALPDYVRNVEQVTLNAFPGALPIQYEPTVFKICRDRSAVAGILRYATDINADLVVLGTHGRNALYEMVLGSVAQDVVRAAPMSVLVVNAMPREQPKCVLAPVGVEPGARDVLEHAARVARREHLPLVALHVVHFDRVEQPAELDIGERERLARVELERLVSQADLQVTTESLVVIGPAADEITRIATQRHAGLVVMAASRHTAMARLMLLGSVTKAVIRKAPCPVLIHRPGEVVAADRVAA